MYRFRRFLGLVLVVSGLALALAGCSGSGGSGDGDDGQSDGGATTTTKTYTNDEYGFSITVDTQFSQGEPAAQASAGGEAVFSIVFADQDGPIASDRYVNAVQISVYEIGRAVEPEEVPQLAQEVQGIVDQLMSAYPSAKVVEPLQEAEINGVPGFGFKYTYEEGGTQITAVSFFLFRGQNEYQITAQATSEDWESVKGKMDAAAGSFTVQ